ncbi:hypothetical protein [Geothrix sp. SG200]|uniref:hypothetical protein n=1 Tax=Geothrix sp. SG200 TaxID=2922865 RepID=UPI001FAE717F|nr:hypothetical protein [Geothrix sp. SG200]
MSILQSICKVASLALLTHSGFVVAQSLPGDRIQATGHGFILSYSKAYYSNHSILVEPRLTHEENGTDFPDGIAPERTKFTLVPIAPAFLKASPKWRQDEASIRFIPLKDGAVKDYATAYPYFYKNYQSLKSILRLKDFKISVNHDLPDWNQGDCIQSIHAKSAIIETPWCVGLQYISTCLQEATQLDNDRLYYKFEGISRDEQFYISIEIPITHPSLPMPAPGLESAAPPIVDSYFTRAEQTLNKYSDSSYFPTLQSFKDLIQSIKPIK